MAVLSVRSTSVQAWLDVAGPVLLAVLAMTQLVADPPPVNPSLVTVCALTAVLPLVARRRAPLLVTVLVVGGVVGQVVAAEGAPATFASFVAVMVCTYTLFRQADPRSVAAGLALIAVAVAATAVLEPRTAPFQPFEIVYPLFYFGAAGGIGAFVRQRALRLSAVEGRAAALEGELQREAELAAAEERARIARELHDVVAHGLSLMVVQAEAAEEMLARDPGAAAQPLRRVQDTGRQSLAEMRRLLGVLRAADPGPPSTAPQPSLRGLPDLVREAAEVGLPVEVDVAGEPGELPPGLELAAYRIVQEALTNTRRHARATRACVRLTYEPEALRVEIADDGSATQTPRAGHGLIGMRERAALYDGTLDAGPGPGGGFRVVAVLPRGTDR
ncbi:sensor histidine kinase [Blastococcus sp. CT_GayMR20]|uniref:sensor histidine kinase n=1 Tax=Blastococcus sp. CT_GayMR20 TaxID=2559609 RepID=UPI0010733F97|nr:sensor histidine kinase [Blastococcus sp. CT_GayMR20]TFV86669.1 sensor histidine kinase [Blastococcus sp. CT_GayMR20]